ncbi:hypothetical protein SAMN05421837_107409 [Amycolatopsis pretoriensis]|uniref:Uncharacterized protein n=1 Tax=Amycolatopsis pretoriensis TaxID=218821 RepID=A0A1H5R8T6_9PSEU|nr:hypothetical protein [Amycolatopsis pretoriensis]SEF34484.1 hypothetical protein SAMN05421837_107409 [Amycolatopsis pretoriensis]
MPDHPRPLTRADFTYGYAEFDAGDTVRMGGDRLLPRRITAYITSAPDLPATMLTIEARDGVPVCTAVTVTAKDGGREVRAVDLRAIKLEDWIEAIVAEVAPTIVASDDDGRPIIVSPAPGTPDAQRLAVAAVRAARHGTRKTVTEDHLRTVAEVYNAADPRRGIKTVEERFGTSYRTAARWIAAARDKGFIPERDEK